MSNTHRDNERVKAKRTGNWKFNAKRSKKHSSNLKFCNCVMCRFGRKAGWNQAMIKRMIASNRQDTKNKLANGDYDNIENEIGIPYTD